MSTRRLRQGFSLIEIGMALVLLALIFVPVLEVLRSGVKGTGTAMRLTRAFQAGRSVIDVAESFAFTELTDGALKSVADTLELPEGVERPLLEPIKLVPAGPGAVESKVVTVRVGFQKTEGKGERGEIVLHGLVPRAR